MNFKWWHKLSWTLVLIILLAACGQSAPSGATPPARGGVPDLAERGLMTPTGWYWLTGVSVDTVKDKIADGYRIFDLEVDSTSPFRVSVAMVKNEGEYKKGWWWYYGQTSDQVKNLISDKKARIIDFEIYYVNGKKRYAVVMVPNSGASAKGWWYYSGLTFSQIGEKVSEKKGRLLDLDSYMVNGQRRYNIVMIPNSGTDQKAWWYYVNITADTLKTKLSDNKARITDLEIHSNGRFNVIMEKGSGETWWYYYGQTMAQVNDKTQQKGARLIDVERYKNSSGQTRFAVVMLKNGAPKEPEPEPEPEPDNGTTDELTERSLTTPTGWWWLTGVSADAIKNKIKEGYRIIDLEVDATSPYRFTVAFVKNTGEHKKGWWWYYGQTGNQVKDLVAKNKGRIIDLQIYRVNGQKRYAVVMVSNTGKDAKAWWYYSDHTIQSLLDKVKDNDARLVDLDSYVVNGQRLYSGVMLKNKGNDAKTWYYYYNVSASFVADKLKDKKARLVDIERHSANTFTVIMEKNPGKAWWWYYGVSMDQVNALTAQNGARIIDIERYVSGGKTRFNVIMLNNVNALTSKLRGILGKGVDGGAYGLYLRQLDGPTLASLQSNFVFEPASTIKALHHVHAMLRVQAGAVNLNTQVPWFTDYVLNGDGTNSSCPTDTSAASETLSASLKAMMENSDNRRTQAIRAFFGENNINNTASNLGMTSTQIQHRIGCGGGADGAVAQPNQLTLQDAGRLYEAVADGLLTPALREDFYDLMLTSSGSLTAIIDDEAVSLGLSASAISSFKGDLEFAAKAGSYGLSTGSYRSIAGWASIPFKQRGRVVQKDYVFGFFVDGIDDFTDDYPGTWQMGAELLRSEIKAALATYK